ncbi:hypothetical protein [Nocardioides ultimimeridianus]
MLRRRRLATVHPGVYVDHTGPLTQRQREWAAVLAVWPAALSGRSALGLPAAGGIEVAVDWARRPSGPPGVVVRRTRSFDQRVVWAGDPPALLPEHAVIDVAQELLAQRDVATAYALIANSRDRVTIWRVRSALEGRERVGHRRILAGLIDDVADGSHSVLERGFLTEVARPHGLPPVARQVRGTADGRAVRYDLRYAAFGVIVEPDGFAFHGTTRMRDADAHRDLATLAETGDITVRITYGQVFRDGCATAMRLGAVLARRGWEGRPTRCARC